MQITCSGDGLSLFPIDTLWINAHIATMTRGEIPYGLIERGAIAICDGHIQWVGAMELLPEGYEQQCSEVYDCKGRLVTPGLIDCHTHIVFAGNRAKEFEMRLQGASYEAIAKAGGGIISTVNATRAASEIELYDQSAARLEAMIAEGVTSIEIKSGYGLNIEHELKMLRVARQLGQDYPIDILTTFLGAHAIPENYKGCSDAYIDLVCKEMLPAIAAEGLADHVDAFCEGIAFSVEQVARVFNEARRYGLPTKLHAEQLSDLKGAVYAAKAGALSVDHLEYLTDEDVTVLAKYGTVAVLLPGAFYYLRETQLPPIHALREHNVPMALATDNNPGSSPVTSLPLIMNMACTLFQLTPEETLAGTTCHAAQALGLQDQVGSIVKNKRANLVCWNATEPAEISYHVGGIRYDNVVFNGVRR